MKTLHLTLLEQLAHTPAPYLQGRDALFHNAQWAVVPQPTYTELDAALEELEKEGYVTSVRNPLLGLRYSITDAGRAALKS